MAEPFILGSGISNYIDAVKTDFGDVSDISDETIRDIIIKAVRRINWRLETSFQYFPAASGFSPMPSEKAGDIIILQTECLLSKRRATSFVKNRGGIKVRELDKEIDTSDSATNQIGISKDFCQELEDLLDEIKEQEAAGVHGELIWYGNSRIIEPMDHNGQGSGEERDYSSPFDPDSWFTGDGTCR